MTADLAARLRETIRRQGPITFDRFVEAALYDPDGGFFTAGGGAGRAEGDFITSPEVGSLFGALVARALDDWWRALGEPDPFVVVEAGAGRGQLARDVLRAPPTCAPALRYVMVERSPALRRLQHDHLQIEPVDEALGPSLRLGQTDETEPVPGTGPIVTQAETMPSGAFVGVVVANELLDNLPFGIVEVRSGRWYEVRVAVDAGDGFTEVVVPAGDDVAEECEHLLGSAADLPDGARLPFQAAVRDWFDECSRVLKRGVVAVLDYAAPARQLAERGAEGWLRTYRAQGRGAGPLDAPGSQDITADVAVEAIVTFARREGFTPTEDVSQAHWLRQLGLDDLVEDGRRRWEEGAHRGDLAALAGRSWLNEAAALTDPAGLGAHRVLTFTKGP